MPHKPVILMCPPDHFEPAPAHPEYGHANNFEKEGRQEFERDPVSFRARAHEQWHTLREILSRHADIILIEPQPEKPDQVYTADASFSLHLHGAAGREIVTILSNFTNEKRAHETEKHHLTLSRLDDERLFVQSLHKIEGNGDNVPDPFRGIIWSGYTDQANFSMAAHGRSSLEAHEFLSDHTKVPVVSLRTIKPFYHSATSRMKNARMKRKKHHLTLSRLDDERLFVQSLHKIEGNGDNVPDPFRGIIWSGYTDQANFSMAAHGRSSLEAHEFLSDHTKVPVVSLRTIKPFYHIDTVLGPLPNGHILAHHKSLHPDSHKKFLTHAFENYGLDPHEYLIPVTTKDAFLLAANVRCFGNHVIMPNCSPELHETVRSKGYEVEIADISAFLAGGGGIHCLSNVINEPMPVPG